MGEVDLSLLDVPRDRPPADPDAYLRAAMDWHFSPETGSPFWLRAAAGLDFDPRADIRTHDDLRRFPNLLDGLRDLPVNDLIPRGYGSPPPVARVYESGGTTGAPKRTAQLPDWVEQVTRWQTEDFLGGGFVAGGGLLCLMPSGPHGVSHFTRAVGERLGSTVHAIDLDPRWVKKLGARGATDETQRYLDHIVGQTAEVLRTQDIVNLHATPPMLNAIARDDTLVDLLNARTRYILLSGAHVDPDTFDLYGAIFPDVAITVAYGSTMILSQAVTRAPAEPGGSFVFDPRSPYVVFWVVDPETGAPVPYGQRGQVVMNHVSKNMFLPNNLERDTAIRIPGPPGQVGDSVSEILPVATFDGEVVIEGVY